MVLTKEELIASLQNEVRILLHLAGKIDRKKLDYRPAPKQRSTLELLQYLVVMGPMLIRAVKAGAFDGDGRGFINLQLRRRQAEFQRGAPALQSDQFQSALVPNLA